MTGFPWVANFEVKALAFTDPDSPVAQYREMSYCQLEFVGKQAPSGDVFGWYTIAASRSPCEPDLWADQATAKANKAGASLASYDMVSATGSMTSS